MALRGRPLVLDRTRLALQPPDGSIFEEDTPIRLITQVRPNVLVKGGDYAREQVVGYDIVEAHGGRVMLVDVLPGFSTTSLVNRARGGVA